MLDTKHGADYFRRWHREKKNSGGLLDAQGEPPLRPRQLVDRTPRPRRVFASGGLRFYGAENAAARGLGERPTRGTRDGGTTASISTCATTRTCKALYLDAEEHDGYLRDRDVFGEGITIEDNLALVVDYANGATLSYSLNAHAPWEGYRVAVNGTAGPRGARGRRARRRASTARASPRVLDPSAADAGGRPRAPEGERLLLQRHWEAAGRGRRSSAATAATAAAMRSCSPTSSSALARTRSPRPRELARRRAVDRGRHRRQPLARDRPARARSPISASVCWPNRRPMSRIVVTGGSGRLGRTLVAGLAERGHEMLSLDRAPSEGLAAANVEQVALDLTDAAATARALDRRAGRRGDPPRRDRGAVQRAGGRHPPARTPHWRCQCSAGRWRPASRGSSPRRVRRCSATARRPGGRRSASPSTRSSRPAVERLRPLEARSSSSRSRCSRVRPATPSATRRSGPATSSPRRSGRAPRPSRGTPCATASMTPRCRRPHCSTTSTHGMSRLRRHAGRRRSTTSPTARCSSSAPTMPSPASRSRSSSPASTPAPRPPHGPHRHLPRLLERQGPAPAGLATASTIWRTELPDTLDPDTRKDPPTWTSTASSSSR